MNLSPARPELKRIKDSHYFVLKELLSIRQFVLILVKKKMNSYLKFIIHHIQRNNGDEILEKRLPLRGFNYNRTGILATSLNKFEWKTILSI